VYTVARWTKEPIVLIVRQVREVGGCEDRQGTNNCIALILNDYKVENEVCTRMLYRVLSVKSFDNLD